MRIRSIDGLRAIMIMFIVLLHSCRFGVSWGSGTIANLFFFVISGYLLYGRDITDGIFAFLWGRLKKIYPAYILSTALIIAFGYFRGFINLIMNVTMTSSGWFVDDETLNGPAWFLCVLILAYIVFYVIKRYIGAKYRPYVLLMLMIGFHVAGEAGFNIPFLYSRTMIGISEFMAGCVLKHVSAIIKPERRYTAALIVAAVGVVTIILRYFLKISIFNTVIYFGMILIPMIIFISVNGKVITRALSFYPLSYIGKKSMYLFLWHRPLLTVFNRITHNENTWISDIRYELLYIFFVIVFCLLYSLAEDRVRITIKNMSDSKDHELS